MCFLEESAALSPHTKLVADCRCEIDCNVRIKTAIACDSSARSTHSLCTSELLYISQGKLNACFAASAWPIITACSHENFVVMPFNLYDLQNLCCEERQCCYAQKPVKSSIVFALQKPCHTTQESRSAYHNFVTVDTRTHNYHEWHINRSQPLSQQPHEIRVSAKWLHHD